jgi:hypothetical protein
LFIFFNGSPRESLCTQFLYQFPPKLPPGAVRCRGAVGYNSYEKKALAFCARQPGHLAPKLFIEMQARDTASFLRQAFSGIRGVGACLPSLWDLFLKRRN